MDALLIGCCAAVGACAFAAAFVATASAGMPMRRVGGDGPLAGLLARMHLQKSFRRLEEHAALARGKADCLRQMPVMLDVVTLGLSAGLSFDSALELYCKRYHNLLATELGSAMLAWRLGTASREEALQAVANRLGVSSLERFAAVVTQALAFGSPLAATLEQQAQTIRDEQRAQMEEVIEQVPIKMLIPLGTLIVPAMLLAILGPLLGTSLQMG
ncbi:MAG: type II secretion system F family protein [Atopobiaceae bacterium]|nr:type II secretion system F family protein [Atopobiaceae bacterium]